MTSPAGRWSPMTSAMNSPTGRRSPMTSAMESPTGRMSPTMGAMDNWSISAEVEVKEQDRWLPIANGQSYFSASQLIPRLLFYLQRPFSYSALRTATSVPLSGHFTWIFVSTNAFFQAFQTYACLKPLSVKTRYTFELYRPGTPSLRTYSKVFLYN